MTRHAFGTWSVMNFISPVKSSMRGITIYCEPKQVWWETWHTVMRLMKHGKMSTSFSSDKTNLVLFFNAQNPLCIELRILQSNTTDVRIFPSGMTYIWITTELHFGVSVNIRLLQYQHYSRKVFQVAKSLTHLLHNRNIIMRSINIYWFHNQSS